MAVRPPKRLRLTPRWPALRRLFAKASTTPVVSARVIHDYFRHKAHAQGYTLSHSQQRVIECMAHYAPLLPGSAQQKLPGLYLHGAVGRGKSWLLDGFFQAIPIAEKKRLHFHQFFAQLHQEIFTHREQTDAMELSVDHLLDGCRVLCFDEFHVHDIGDAMLITRLFQALFRRGILLLVTSNYPPEGLLPNPLYHARFKPVIDLINSKMQVMEVGGPHDYRSQARHHAQQVFTQGHYLWPDTLQIRRRLNFPEADALPLQLSVGTRQLQARFSDRRTIGFTFTDLCEHPTAVMDYLELCRQFDHWIIVDLPLLADTTIAAQQRFINLVDVLYDQDKHLTLVSQHSLSASLGGDAIDLARTRSRLGQLMEINELN